MPLQDYTPSKGHSLGGMRHQGLRLLHQGHRLAASQAGASLAHLSLMHNPIDASDWRAICAGLPQLTVRSRGEQQGCKKGAVQPPQRL